MNESNYIDVFTNSLLNIIQVMAGVKDSKSKAVVEPLVFVSRGLAVFIGITGTRTGRIILDTSMETARRLSELIFCETGLGEEDIINSMAEFANIVAGHGISQIKTLQKNWSLMLTPPSVFFSKEINIASPGIRSIVAEIDTPAGFISISIGFEE